MVFSNIWICMLWPKLGTNRFVERLCALKLAVWGLLRCQYGFGLMNFSMMNKAVHLLMFLHTVATSGYLVHIQACSLCGCACFTRMIFQEPSQIPHLWRIHMPNGLQTKMDWFFMDLCPMGMWAHFTPGKLITVAVGLSGLDGIVSIVANSVDGCANACFKKARLGRQCCLDEVWGNCRHQAH